MTLSTLPPPQTSKIPSGRTHVQCPVTRVVTGRMMPTTFHSMKVPLERRHTIRIQSTSVPRRICNVLEYALSPISQTVLPTQTRHRQDEYACNVLHPNASALLTPCSPHEPGTLGEKECTTSCGVCSRTKHCAAHMSKAQSGKMDAQCPEVSDVSCSIIFHLLTSKIPSECRKIVLQ